MAGTIKITPQELRDASTYLGQRLDAINIQTNDLKKKLDQISTNWEGAAQSAFISDFSENMWPVLSRHLPELINGIQTQLTETAQTLEDTDQAIADKLKMK